LGVAKRTKRNLLTGEGARVTDSYVPLGWLRKYQVRVGHSEWLLLRCEDLERKSRT